MSRILQGVLMLEQLCWAFFHGQSACEAAFLVHSPNCHVTIAAARDARAAASSSRGSCHACGQLKEEAPLWDQEPQPHPEAASLKCDDETITDDSFQLPSRVYVRGLNDAAVNIISESNSARRRSSHRLVRNCYTENKLRRVMNGS